MTESTYKITYKMVLKEREMLLQASSKYDAKKKFYAKHPKWEIVKVELVPNVTEDTKQ